MISSIKTKRTLRRSLLLFVTFLLLSSLSTPSVLESASLSSVKDTLSTSRLSFKGELAGDHVSGATLITLEQSSLAAGRTSDTNDNLFPGDSIVIDDGPYTIGSIVSDSTSQFTTTSGLDPTDVNDADIVIFRSLATHTITFTTNTVIAAGGAVRVLIKADSTTSNDGTPDDEGFDFNSIPAGDITCPTGGGPGAWITPTATASGDGGCTAGYHCFECPFEGQLNTAQALTFTIGDGDADDLINPAPSATTKTLGVADTYSFYVQILDSADSFAVKDQTQGRIAVLEAVRVTATVDPTIQLTITGVAASQTRCGQSTKDTSTATLVPFGSLSVASAFGNIMSQQVSAVTNGPSGYAVTVFEDDQLSIGGAGVTEISDTDCDSGAACSNTTTSGNWHTETDQSGWGYSIQNIDADTVPFQYNVTSGNCSIGTFCARPFPVGSSNAVSVMSNTSTPSDTEDIYMCYKIVAATSQTAGDYENRLVYTATATF
jgi:hypothetical protein